MGLVLYATVDQLFPERSMGEPNDAATKPHIGTKSTTCLPSLPACLTPTPPHLTSPSSSSASPPLLAPRLPSQSSSPYLSPLFPRFSRAPHSSDPYFPLLPQSQHPHLPVYPYVSPPQVARALDALHGQDAPIIHRDIKVRRGIGMTMRGRRLVCRREHNRAGSEYTRRMRSCRAAIKVGGKGRFRTLRITLRTFFLITGI